MRFVARAFAQLKELLLSLSPAMRMVAALLLAAVGVGVWFLFFANWGGGGVLVGIPCFLVSAGIIATLQDFFRKK